MATELAFAKSFLSLLDSKPTKISADHVEDPRSYPGSTPYIIPRHPTFKPFSKRPRTTTTTTTGTTSSQENNQPAPSAQQKQQLIPVTLRSPRNPPLEVSLPPQPPTTSLGEIKELFAARTGLPVDKVKLLFGKKPVGDSKALGELLLLGGGAGGGGSGSGGEGGEGAVVELGVMVLGGAATAAAAAAAAGVKKEGGEEEEEGAGAGAEKAAAAAVAQGLHGEGVLATGQFWEDLRGFLQQRIRDEGVAEEACGVFKGAWERRS
ncbi:uncharacterized protein THITE_2093046 [Thermothielavioides terrestris NRRL 8126]|uniref:Ubiquitin-like domain-containing protein n=1 Tax=Thermothielavioides terrestris (strain ATCC 38088 / NRRL 8126) TaxID=578455 RepID=G2RI87_THETT|nr:uncharacterized protein THITE_2093046 [Thermothielavioides terrestris NRRL 8126]AEO71549.1 hypothetical protein THITE_2093046 [Thermothielavioides terrestris NRRL 8126]